MRATSGCDVSTRPQGSPMAGDDVDHAGREARLLDQACRTPACACRGLLGRLQNHRVPRGKRWAKLHRHQEQLRVPRHHRSNDPDRLAGGEDMQVGLVDRQGGAHHLVGERRRRSGRTRRCISPATGSPSASCRCPTVSRAAEHPRSFSARRSPSLRRSAPAAFGRGHPRPRAPRERRGRLLRTARFDIGSAARLRNLGPGLAGRRVDAVEGSCRPSAPVQAPSMSI